MTKSKRIKLGLAKLPSKYRVKADDKQTNNPVFKTINLHTELQRFLQNCNRPRKSEAEARILKFVLIYPPSGNGVELLC